MEWLLVGVGLFSMCGGAFGWAWFMRNRKAMVFVNLLGVKGARVFYVVLGICILAVGLLGVTGVIEL